MSLQADGYRFVHRKEGNKFTWVHPLELRSDDFDCTDMSDEEFQIYTLNVLGEPQRCPNTGDLFGDKA